MIANDHALRNLELLQTFILGERDHDSEAANRGLILDVLRHVSEKSRFVHVIGSQPPGTIFIRRYGLSNELIDKRNLHIENLDMSSVRALTTRHGRLLLIDRFMKFMLSIDVIGNLSVRRLSVDVKSYRMISIQNGDIIFLFAYYEGKVCTLDTTTGLFTDWKSPPTFPTDIDLWYNWGQKNAVATKSCILIFVGKDSTNDTRVFKYCYTTEEFSVVAHPALSNMGGWACCLLDDDTVLLTGGYDDAGASAACSVYHIETNTWNEFAPMNIPRKGHVIAKSANGDIMVFNGYTRSDTFLDSFEVYNQSTRKWSVFEMDTDESHTIGALTI